MTNDLFMRLATVHKPDCVAIAEGPAPEPVADPATLAVTLGSDALARYAGDCQPIYENLRRVIGQISGLMILARLTGHIEVADLPELAACQARWNDADERTAALAAPQAAQPHREQLVAACLFSGLALKTFSALGQRADNDAAFDRMVGLTKRAYAHLSAASTEKAGLNMVDFTHACCSCRH
ncbi:hypothetical protein [Rhizobium sp. SGZ-381]|uniref:hypothetical protein n=1 Tax=Rhizobium sp. SGZ-381 TaxID=3342800 RepID=UPI00366C77C0